MDTPKPLGVPLKQRKLWSEMNDDERRSAWSISEDIVDWYDCEFARIHRAVFRCGCCGSDNIRVGIIKVSDFFLPGRKR
jgi:hypothetical protein